jgi:hypothetical protein
MGTQAINGNQCKGNQNFTPQFLNTPDILKGLYELFHETQMFKMMPFVEKPETGLPKRTLVANLFLF